MVQAIILGVLLATAVAVLTAACGRQSAGDTPVLQPPSAAATASTGAPRVAQAEASAAVAPTASAAQSQASAPGSTAPSSPSPPPSPVATHNDAAPSAQQSTRLAVLQGSKATYRVREQLAGVDFPSDAVGATTLVAGAIVMSADGNVLPGQSRLTVDLRVLTSDDPRRDRFLRNTTLRTVLYPTAEFVPAEAVGLALPPPTSESAAFQVKGDMTLHGVTKPLTWDVTAPFSETQVTGAATTAFTFADFGLSVPRVFLILSVEETIRLKVDFQLNVTKTRVS